MAHARRTQAGRRAVAPVGTLRAGPRRTGPRPTGTHRHRAPAPRSSFAGLAAWLVRPGAALLVATAFVAGGVTGASLGQVRRDDHATQVAQVEAEHAALVARVDQAATTRLTGQAAGYAALRRSQALVLAETAVRAAQVLSDEVSPVVGEQSLLGLDLAVADLAALVDSAPPTAPVTIEPVVPEPTPEAPPAPTELGADAVVLVRTAQGEPAQPEPDAADQARRMALTTSLELDLELTDRVVAAAEQVLALSAQVQAEADAIVAAAHAEEQARAAAQAAAAAAAAELTRRVTEADAAPNGEIPRDLLCDVGFDPEVELRCDAAQALEALNAAYRADTGRDLVVVSSYRDLDEQAVTRAAKGALAAAPGASNHGRGIAIDLAGAGELGVFTAPLYLWLSDHARDHGWSHPSAMEPGGVGPLEPWHWEFGTD